MVTASLALKLAPRRPASLLIVSHLDKTYDGRGPVNASLCRKQVLSLSPAGLKRAANGAYGVAETEFNRLFGHARGLESVFSHHFLRAETAAEYSLVLSASAFR